MNPTDPTPSEERLSDLAAACDEALAEGDDSLQPEMRLAGELAPELAKRFDCMRLLRQVFPGKRSAVSPAGTEADVPTPSADGGDEAPPATIVAGYEILDELGRGGMGVVRRALDWGLGREVAIKQLKPGTPADSPAAARFVHEAKITGQLQHPGIPAVHELGTL